MDKDPSPELPLRVQSWLFAASLILGGLLFFALPKGQVSVEEKRELAKPPHLSYNGVVSGKFFDDADSYYSDNFIFRNFFIGLADRIKEARGLFGADMQVYEAPPIAPKSETPGAGQALPPSEDLDAPYERIRSVIVTRGRAVQIFRAVNGMADPFATMVNDYQAALGPGVRIYCMAIPAGADMFLPRSVNKGVMEEKINTDYLYSRLDPAIVRVDAYGALLAHRNEYIQFHTDHHWTGLGAYYAYTAFARAAGFQPLALSAFTRKEIPNYLGTLYYRTRSSELRARGDTVQYFMPPVQTQTTVFPSGIEHGFPGQLYYESATGGNAYGVFLGGDNPLMRVVTSNRSGRRIVVVKDSYGNAFAPYLAAHYDELFIVDYRYFRGSIPALMRRYDIRELIFANNTFVVNTAGTVVRGRKMLQDPEAGAAGAAGKAATGSPPTARRRS